MKNINIEESIYKIIPQIIIQSPKKQSYQSKFPPTIHPTASTFGLHSSSFPDICNLKGDFSLPIGSHPLTQLYASFGKPYGSTNNSPNNLTRKNSQFKNSPQSDIINKSS